jgi:hypothetical protein
MSQSKEPAELAAAVRDLEFGAKLVATFLRVPEHRERMLRYADLLEQEATRLESMIQTPTLLRPEATDPKCMHGPAAF